MQVTLECFGAAGRLAGGGPLSLTMPDGCTVQGLFALLADRSPEWAALVARCACARGDAIVPRSTVLGDGDELALLPPVAGG